MPKFALNVGCLSVLMLFLMGSFRLFGQVGASGTITGLVTDSTGAVIPGCQSCVDEYNHGNLKGCC